MSRTPPMSTYRFQSCTPLSTATSGSPGDCSERSAGLHYARGGTSESAGTAGLGGVVIIDRKEEKTGTPLILPTPRSPKSPPRLRQGEPPPLFRGRRPIGKT